MRTTRCRLQSSCLVWDLYKHTHFKGDVWTLSHGQYRNPTAGGFPADTISSVRRNAAAHGSLSVVSSTAGSGSPSQAKVQNDTVVELVLDASDSMNTGKIGNESRLKVAKDAMREVVKRYCQTVCRSRCAPLA